MEVLMETSSINGGNVHRQVISGDYRNAGGYDGLF